MTGRVDRLGAAARLGLFAAVLALCFGLGAGLGAALPQLRDTPSASTVPTTPSGQADPAHDAGGHGS